MTKNNIAGLDKEELKECLANLGQKTFRAEQIWNWLYVKGVKSFDEMNNISATTKEVLSKNYTIERPKVTKDLTALDGTRKILLSFSDCKEVEAVFIPEETRGTICISSQVGCTLACTFCHTGTQLFVRNLTSEEIIWQILVMKDLLNDWSGRKITNIVFMGMGEPFFNYDNVRKASEILNSADGLNFSKRRITISTSGLVPEIIKAADEVQANLAISLHATNDKLRTEIMAINKKYPLEDLMQACKYYNQQNPSQKITFEYVMLKDVNDSKENAQELVNLIIKHNVNAKVNLIPFNSWEGCEFTNSSNNQIHRFQDILKANNIIATIRKTRGEDVMAACGQLKSLSERKSKSLKVANSNV